MVAEGSRQTGAILPQTVRIRARLGPELVFYSEVQPEKEERVA